MILRTKGKNNANFKSDEFYKEYCTIVKEPLPKKEFNSVREAIYDEIVKALYREGEIKLHYKFGTLAILKEKRKITYNKDGTINKVNYKVDWKKTKEYWAEKYPGLSQEELKLIKGKPKVYCDTEWRYTFNYLRQKGHYINKNFLWMIICRDAARGLKTYVDANPHVDYKEK
jgi:nucleoid DNA-binding protein